MTIFNDLGDKYDQFVDWNRRLSAEIPFLIKLLRSNQSKKILDVGCATGMHAIELAKQGFQMHGIDLSENMIAKAKKNALESQQYLHFEVLSMLDIAKHQAKPFDSVIMLGNVVSMLRDEKEVQQFFTDAKTVLKTGGKLIIQTLNYRLMRQTGEKFELITTTNPDLLFVKVFELDAEIPKLSVLMLEKEDSKWTMKGTTQEIMMLSKEDLVRCASRCKYGSISLYGKLDGSPFKGESSDQLIAVFSK